MVNRPSKASKSVVLVVSRPLWVLWRSAQRVHLLDYDGQPLPEADAFVPLRTGSGPLLDRIDIHIEVPRVEYEKLSDERLGEPSAAIRERVEAARQRQRERFTEKEGTITCNADMRPAEVRKHCELDD